jgi:uncharacterized protein (TIGR02284 family)
MFLQETAMQISHEITSVLNHLIEVCRDGQRGFESAAKAIKEPVLRAELNQYSMQRADFAEELKAAAESQGELADDGGSVMGALHLGWTNLKAALVSNDRYTILAECERGEDAALKAYRDAFESDLPESVETIIESQFQQVRRVHDRIKELRDASRPA